MLKVIILGSGNEWEVFSLSYPSPFKKLTIELELLFSERLKDKIHVPRFVNEWKKRYEVRSRDGALWFELCWVPSLWSSLHLQGLEKAIRRLGYLVWRLSTNLTGFPVLWLVPKLLGTPSTDQVHSGPERLGSLCSCDLGPWQVGADLAGDPKTWIPGLSCSQRDLSSDLHGKQAVERSYVPVSRTAFYNDLSCFSEALLFCKIVLRFTGSDPLSHM